MSKISQKVSGILDVHIPEGKWESQVDAIDRGGEPTRKHATAIMFALAQLLEELQGELQDVKERGKHVAPHKS